MRRRPIYCTHTVIIAIGIAATSFASIATIVSGFCLHDSLSLPFQQEYNERRKERKQSMRLQAADCRSGDDESFTTVELSDTMSRRQTLATLAVSFGTLCSIPPTAFAEQSSTTKNDSRTIHTTHTIATDPVQSTSRSESITSKTKSPSSELSSFQESISGFVAGASLAGTKTLVKFPLDTATVRLQMPNSAYSIRDPLGLFKGSLNGISFTLLSNIPAGAVFFGVKDAVKTAIKNSGDGSISTMPSWLSTSLAVGVAQVPYWLVRNPSEVVKVRQQANIDGYGGDVSAIDAVKLTFKSDKEDGEKNNGSDFYTGYWENFLYAFPADVMKFVAYESITKGRKDLSPFEGATAGALATGLAQVVTTPLDVVRNRLMTGKNGNGSSLSQEEKNKGYIESLITLGKEEGLSGLFAGTTPRASKAILSGAIQFAAYEETKQSMSKILLRR
jgi:solute carrier family 25 S-adenosylmethionine transporter 26